MAGTQPAVRHNVGLRRSLVPIASSCSPILPHSRYIAQTGLPAAWWMAGPKEPTRGYISTEARHQRWWSPWQESQAPQGLGS